VLHLSIVNSLKFCLCKEIQYSKNLFFHIFKIMTEFEKSKQMKVLTNMTEKVNNKLEYCFQRILNNYLSL